MKTLIDLMGIRYAELAPEYLKPYQEYRQKQLEKWVPSIPPLENKPWKPNIHKKSIKLADTIEVIRETRTIDWN